MNHVAEFGLIFGDAAELIEPRPNLVFQDWPPEIDHFSRGHRRCQAGQPFAHQHRQRVRQWRIGAVGDLVEFAAVKMIVQHRREVLGNAGHAPCADGLHARLLDGLEHAARLRVAGHQFAMHFRVMAGKL